MQEYDELQTSLIQAQMEFAFLPNTKQIDADYAEPIEFTKVANPLGTVHLKVADEFSIKLHTKTKPDGRHKSTLAGPAGGEYSDVL